MRTIIWNSINWEENTKYTKEKCTLEIEDAKMSNATMALALTLRTNFYVSDADILAIKHNIKKEIPLLSTISIEFIYEDMQSAVQTSGNTDADATQGKQGNPASQARASKQKTAGHASYSKSSAKNDKYVPGNNRTIIGAKIKEPSIPIELLERENMTATIEGFVIKTSTRKLKNGKTLVNIIISDYTESIPVKVFATAEKLKAIEDNIHEGTWIKVHGKIEYDNYERSIVMYVTQIEAVKKEKRMDMADKKRIELHAHTKMSAMDGLADAADLVKTAESWGHTAIAITDHAVVQSFPDIIHASKNIKVILGMEGYLVDDMPSNGRLAGDGHLSDKAADGRLADDGHLSDKAADGRLADDGHLSDVSANLEKAYLPLGLDDEYVVFDIETTGLSPLDHEIIEIGAVKVKKRKVTERFHAMVKPKCGDIPAEITALTGITTEMVKDADAIETILPDFMAFAGNLPMVAHNADFDMGFINVKAAKQNIPVKNRSVDTLYLSRLLLKDLKKYRLDVVARHFGIDMGSHHRADDDANTAALILIGLLNILEENSIYDIDDVADINAGNTIYKIKNTNHVTILAKNQTGLKNLYKLVTLSHMNYFYKKPRIPKSILAAHRDGLIIGSACQGGEVYQGFLSGKSAHDMRNICKFYDYLEVQPIGNNEFLINKGLVDSKNTLIEINKRIIACAGELSIPVIATSDVHYIEPHEHIYRNILLSGQGFKDIEERAELYLRTTDEMLSEFSYLDERTAYDVVIGNPEKIAEQIDTLRPVPADRFPPKMANSEDELHQMCEKRATEIYGTPLPDIVRTRLDKELASIIGNGYAVMYIIAQRLVKKSMDDGYVVGSRGSVGSSLVATMSGITEVNPLPPHYVCPKCKHSEFQQPGGAYGCGVDMPEKNCPVCNTPYSRDGFEIPFEVFLGFEGDKEPDIDLNFAGEYQATAHKHMEVLFGKENVFRAGTISTVASKTAFGFVKKYFEDRGINKSKWEADRLIKSCEGVKRTTGQHPGGIIILPKGMDIHDICPVQYPANDSSSGVKTTHFDYHSIDQNLMKLDILGHDAPSIIRMLKDMTGIDPQTVSLSDKKVNSLFLDTSALGLKFEGFRFSKGSLGIPEFGTKFVRQMLDDTKPSTFSGLLRISGFSHGTDVWLNNAKDFILGGTVKLENAISVRDDIMIDLIGYGLDKKHAFKIMENVRKGKGITDEDAAAMDACNVPKWYLESCRRIKYLFPKAHAVAYVMMAYRIAYFKVYHPLSFYATFFTTKVADFNAEVIVGGISAIDKKLNEIEEKGKDVTSKEQNEAVVMELAYEMYFRGYEFTHPVFGKSDALQFKVSDGKVLLPFAALPGVGANAAKSLVAEYEKIEFASIEEMQERTGITRTAVESLKSFGAVANIPQTNQLSFF